MEGGGAKELNQFKAISVGGGGVAEDLEKKWPLTLERKVLKGLMATSSSGDVALRAWPQVPAASLRCWAE